MLEDVQECVAETVEIIQSYKNRNMVSRAFASPLCKRRLREAEEAIMSAVQRLQVGGWVGGSPTSCFRWLTKILRLVVSGGLYTNSKSPTTCRLAGCYSF